MNLCVRKPVLQATVHTCVGASWSTIGRRSLLGPIGGSTIYSILSESLWAQCLTKRPYLHFVLVMAAFRSDWSADWTNPQNAEF
jgi:hypothetical protein